MPNYFDFVPLAKLGGNSFMCFTREITRTTIHYSHSAKAAVFVHEPLAKARGNS